MAENIKLFRQGGMNTDDATEFIGQEDFVEAYNVRVVGTSEGEEGLATNIESNVLIAGTRPAGLNKTIGSTGFEITRNAYAFIYNSQNKNLIAKLAYDTNTQTNIFENLTNSGAVDILPLDPEYYVNDIKLINDKFLAWTDGNYQPCLVNVERLESGGYGTLTQNDLLLIKGQPMLPPIVEYRNDATRSVNLLQGNLFQFMYQYIYLDNEYSSFSIISKREVPENENTPSVGTSVTANNVLIVKVNIGTNRVKNVNIISRIGTQDFFSIKNISRADILALPNVAINFETEIREVYDPATNIYSFSFYNDGLYVNEDPLITDIPYDYVPLKCETLENVNGNQLALGGLTEGYPRPQPDVIIEAATYNPDVTIVPTNPALALRVENWQQVRVAGTSYRKVTIYYAGIAKQGDEFKIVTSNLNGVVYETITYTVTAGQDGDTEAAVRAFAASMPSFYPTNVFLFDSIYWVLQFTTRRQNETPDGEREQALSVSVSLSGAGTGASVSRPTLKSNSSYQAFLWYKDAWGRYFPISTGNRYVIKTPSYSQIQGLASMLSWQINSLPPADAAYYGWGLSENTTHKTTLWVQGKVDTALSATNYFVFNINPLLKFNQANPSSVLNYEYSPGDRCTFVYYNVGADISTKIWYEKVDVNIVGFDIDVSSAVPPVVNYLLKVKIPTGITLASLTGNNVLLELYTPKQRVASVNEQEQYNEQLFYEIGISYPIVNGQHSVTFGTIKTGDVYIKSRQMVNAVNLNQIDILVVEDFNFSDFYASQFTSYGKPRTFNDEAGRVERKGVIRYSDVLQIDSLVNGLVKFYPESVYGDVDGQSSSNYGWIRKIRQRNNVLVCFQELKVGYIPVFQTIVEDQSSESQYALSFKLFNFIRYNGLNIGMGNAKESYAEWNNNLYFVDPFRSEPIRTGLDGISPISGKMSKYFKRVLQQAYEAGKKIIGYYDIFNNEYLLSTETEGDILAVPAFNSLNWQLEDSYTVAAGAITITAQGTKGVATYNNVTGIATYTPNTGQTGADSFSFSFVVGGVTITKNVCITITAGDTCPNDFIFGAVTGAALSTVFISNAIIISAIDIPTPISITGGEYSINGGAYTSAPGVVVNNDTITVRQTSSATASTLTVATLTVDCRVVPFNVTTASTTTTTTSTTTTSTTTTLEPTTTTTTTTLAPTTTTTTTLEPTTTTTTTTLAPTTTTTTTLEPTTTTTTTTLAPTTTTTTTLEPTTTTTTTTLEPTTTTTTTSTSTTTTTTLPPCICYNLINTTGSDISMLITPCDDGVEISQLVPANNTVTECIETGQYENPPPIGITVELCGGYAQACTDEASCFGCNASTTTTTTSGPTTTTTTTTLALVCGSPSSYTGGIAYPTTESVELGSATGTTMLIFNAINVPDRFIVEWNSSVVIDTGYRGAAVYDFGGGSRASFNASLTGLVDPITLNVYPDMGTYPDDGYPRIVGLGSGVTSFNKSSASPSTATVKVYAPMSGTAWQYTMECPGVTTTTTTN